MVVLVDRLKPAGLLFCQSRTIIKFPREWKHLGKLEFIAGHGGVITGQAVTWIIGERERKHRIIQAPDLGGPEGCLLPSFSCGSKIIVFFDCFLDKQIEI